MAQKIDKKGNNNKAMSQKSVNAIVRPSPPREKRPDSLPRRQSSGKKLPCIDNNSLSRQSSSVSASSPESLPTVPRNVTTLGRHFRIVPPIAQTDLRAVSSSGSIHDDEEITFSDDRVIQSVVEENYPVSLVVASRGSSQSQSKKMLSDPKSSDNMEDSLDSANLTLAVKLLDGSRETNSFQPSDKLQSILNFASGKMQQNLDGYSLRTFNKRFDNLKMTISECEIQDKTLLFLEPP